MVFKSFLKFSKLNQTKSIFFLFTFLFLAFPLYAQDSIEEVIVEAEKREDSTMDLTQSIDAFDLEDLETQQIKGFADISNNVPGLTASPSGAQGLRFTLRGVGARDSQLGIESKVGLYVDGAFLGRASGLVFDIVDLERVEVLKGPQGFTYGRNSIGGAINLITAKANPDERYGRLELKVGNYDRQNLTGLLNLPVTDNFALRGAVFSNAQEGWVENDGLGEDWNGYERDGFRISGRWIPQDNLTVDYSYDKANFDTQPVFYQPQIRDGYDRWDRENYRQDNAPNNIAIWQAPPSANKPSDGPPEVFLPVPQRGRLDQGTATLRPIENSTTEADGHTLAVEWAWSDSHTFNVVGTHRSTEVNNTFYLYPNVASQEALTNGLAEGSSLGDLLQIIEGYDFVTGTYQRWTEDANGNRIGSGIPTFEALHSFNVARDLNTPESNFWADAMESILISGPNNSIDFPEVLGDPGWTQAPLPDFLYNSDFCADLYPFIPGLKPFYCNEQRLALLELVKPENINPYLSRNKFNSLFSSPPGGLAALRGHKQWSLEFKQSGFFLDDRLAYVTGLYYFNERTGNGQKLPEGELYTDLVEVLDFGRAFGLDESISPEDSFGFSLVSINELDTDHLGIYLNIDYTPLSLDERMTLSFGYRHSIDERKLLRQSLQAITLDDRGTAVNEEETWQSNDYTLKIAYDINYDVTGYVSLTSGTRPGNFNVEARFIPQFFCFENCGDFGSDIRFDEETHIAYEFGLKGSLFDGRVDFEWATYYADISDGQESVVFPKSPISRSIVNADGFAYGSELDTTFYLTDELTFTANYALLRSGSDTYVTPFVFDNGGKLLVAEPATSGISDAEIYSRLIADCQGALRRIDTANGRCVERKNNFGAPVNSWQLSLDYRVPTDYGEFFAHIGYSFKDPYFVNDALQVDARHLWDLRIQRQYDLDSGLLRFAFWSLNLFDNEYQTQKLELYSFAYDLAAYGTPRTYGLDLIYEWF